MVHDINWPQVQCSRILNSNILFAEIVDAVDSYFEDKNDKKLLLCQNRIIRQYKIVMLPTRNTFVVWSERFSPESKICTTTSWEFWRWTEVLIKGGTCTWTWRVFFPKERKMSVKDQNNKRKRLSLIVNNNSQVMEYSKERKVVGFSWCK